MRDNYYNTLTIASRTTLVSYEYAHTMQVLIMLEKLNLSPVPFHEKVSDYVKRV